MSQVEIARSSVHDGTGDQYLHPDLLSCVHLTGNETGTIASLASMAVG
jgi:hypothetical protein